jgi:hypothetical protein
MSDLTEFIFYTAPTGGVKVDVLIQDETVWLTQKKIAELFGKSRTNITEHIGNIFSEGELVEEAVCREFRHTAEDGKTYKTQYYNLDAIISVGYRVNSKEATQFRTWATTVLRNYIIKGFALDDELLKNGSRLGKDYFQELLERVRSIRASEKRIYRQITDIFIECSIDYNQDSQSAKDFFAKVQNKFHYAIHGQTAAERIQAKADSSHPNMGLKTFKNAPDGRVLKSDVTVAKNYLSETELKKLERTITSYFDYIENQIELEQSFSMEALASSVDKFLSFNSFAVLEHKGAVSMKDAQAYAATHFHAFNKTQVAESDFDQFVKRSKSIPPTDTP